MRSTLCTLLVLWCLTPSVAWAQAPHHTPQAPLVANRAVPLEALPELARDLLSGALRRGGAEPDTVLPWRYLPLEVGNAWEYETVYNFTNGPVIGHTRIDIPKDTLIGKQHYLVWNEQLYEENGELNPDYSIRAPVRYDSVTARVVASYEGDEYIWFFAPCRLDAAFGTSVECFEGDSFEVSGTYDATLDFEPDTTVTAVAVKTFAVELYLNRFAAGFGKALFQEFNADGYLALRYARLGGEEFGTALFPVAAAPAAPAPAGRVSLSAWPNPFGARLSVGFSLAVPGAVSVEVLDVLGRVVLREAIGVLGAGRHEVRLDGSSLVPGLYVVEVVVGTGVVATRKVLRL